MPEEKTAAGSWLGDLTNEWKSAKPPEKVLIIGGVAVVAGIAFYLYRKQQGQNITSPAGESGQPGQPGGGQTSGFPIVPSGGIPVVPAGESPIFDPNGNLIGWGPTPTSTPPSGTPPPSTGTPPVGTGSSGTGSTGNKPLPPIHHHKHHKHNKEVLTGVAGRSGDRRGHILPPTQKNHPGKLKGNPIIKKPTQPIGPIKAKGPPQMKGRISH